MKILIAVTHLLGAGHLTRAAALARAFAVAGHDTVLVSGGAPAPLIRLDGVRLVQLPPVRIAGVDFTRLIGPDGEPAGPALFDARREGLLTALHELAPDVVITELFPFGRRALAAEFLALVEEARSRPERPLILASVRDILVPPDRPSKVDEAHERIAALYDAVLVHGDPALVPLDASWPVDDRIAPRLRYTGYVDEGAQLEHRDTRDGVEPAAVFASDSEAIQGNGTQKGLGGSLDCFAPLAMTNRDRTVLGSLPRRGRGGVLVSAGSSAAGLGLFHASVEAARRRPDLGWRILVGHGVPEAMLQSLSDGLPPGTVMRARPDYRALLAGAAVSVSQCGYNTAIDLLVTDTPAVLVPFEAGRETEQRLRAERLAALGRARIVAEDALTPETLLAAVLAARSHAEAPAPALDGAARTVTLVEEMHHEALFIRLRDALDHAKEPLRIWWRDDDAVAVTPALDRLLNLAGPRPLLIAAIPAGTEPSLGERLAGSETISLAVHGLAHENHAPPGQKSAEFGPHRDRARLRDEARLALALARSRLPAKRLLPVFVPPWNRIDPAFAAELAELGYVGLSAAGGESIPGLACADSDLDVIDWRGTRSLRDPSMLIADLIARIGRGRIGLLTHHLAHDEAIWRFLEDLLACLDHPAVRWDDPRDLFHPLVDASPCAPISLSAERERAG